MASSSRAPSEKQKSLKEKRDESIMNTNNSCIVSKRSVEKIYYGDDQGFLRHFVRRFQRRSPLVNRGYWLRMQAVQKAVRQFLNSSSEAKTVVNLGCGYDTLPFWFLANEAEGCRLATFVDVDYPDLIGKKASVIGSVDKLQDLLPNVSLSSADNPIVVSSDYYYAVACDLQDLDTLGSTLRSLPGLAKNPILFVSEVAMTYMEVDAADAVIRWASDFEDARFCLLEQFLPEGASHPFAETMIQHFEKLSSPLKAPLVYEKLDDQEMRFLDAGWKGVRVTTLWSLWSDDTVISAAERMRLDSIEPFDEWEEFALFASHYFLLYASNLQDTNASLEQPTANGSNGETKDRAVMPTFSKHKSGKGLRRHGAAVCPSSAAMFHHGGQGTRSRLPSADVLIPEQPAGHGPNLETSLRKLCLMPELDLVCHTLTKIGEDDYVLVGGRRSPEEALSACYRFSNGIWQQIPSLPRGLFRHCAVKVEGREAFDGRRNGLLVFGGKTGDGKLSDDWLYWTPGEEWEKVKLKGDMSPTARFGASMSIFGTYDVYGFLCGGIGLEGTVLCDVWEWKLFQDDEDELEILCFEISSCLEMNGVALRDLSRFGAKQVRLRDGSLLIGGIGPDGVVEKYKELVQLRRSLRASRFSVEWTDSRPLLTGFVAETFGGDNVIIAGGGGVCFSFGTRWNEGCYTFNLDPNVLAKPWTLSKAEINRSVAQLEAGKKDDGVLTQSNVPALETARVQIQSPEEFRRLLEKGEPAIIEGLDLGPCTKLWYPEYLKAKVGRRRNVVVHKSTSEKMNFIDKNFVYETMQFGEFLDAIESGERLYLRSISCTKPLVNPTNVVDDFWEIAEDFKIPRALEHVTAHMHSSPLRISGPVTMWLHYDVMANVLCQIQGEKRVVLFPPEDVLSLEFPHGASSSQLGIFDDTEMGINAPAGTTPYSTVLRPGDVLFIPALWSHTATPSSGLSVAVNVFFRSFSEGYAPGKDVYGNRDVQAYETGRRDVQRIAKSFGALPAEARTFYLSRLAMELAEAPEARGTSHRR